MRPGARRRPITGGVLRGAPGALRARVASSRAARTSSSYCSSAQAAVVLARGCVGRGSEAAGGRQ